MQVFKFGGASIRNGYAIRNIAKIIKDYGEQPLVIVVSAMGKTTRHLEAFIDHVYYGKDGTPILKSIKKYHLQILAELFDDGDGIFAEVEATFSSIPLLIDGKDSYGKFYDSVVANGELLSSTIIAAFLNQQGILVSKIEATKYIKCRGKFQAGKVNWQATQDLIDANLVPLLNKEIVITQGFIGSNEKNEVVTLGKEGSDYTAAIFASCLNAEKVTIWKDVPGILSADPKLVVDTEQILHLPYNEASEMTFYGASVIHPKTIKPLANKSIPLIVRSFDDPTHVPTEISGTDNSDLKPTIILKKNQCLITFRVRDYSFVDEKSLAKIFSSLHQLDISISMLQSSAITISVCFDYKQEYIDAIFSQLKDKFRLHYMTNLELITLKNYDDDFVSRYRPRDEIILEQRSRKNCRFLVRSKND